MLVLLLGYVLQICSAGFGSLCRSSCWIATLQKHRLPAQKTVTANICKTITESNWTELTRNELPILGHFKQALLLLSPRDLSFPASVQQGLEDFIAKATGEVTCSETGPQRHAVEQGQASKSAQAAQNCWGPPVYLFINQIMVYLFINQIMVYLCGL